MRRERGWRARRPSSRSRSTPTRCGISSSTSSDGRLAPVEQIGALIVDDQADVRRLIRLIIEDADHELFVSGEASSGPEAIEAAEKLKPDVVVMDYMMAEMDGVKAASEILERDPGQAVILCTAFLDEAL